MNSGKGISGKWIKTGKMKMIIAEGTTTMEKVF